MSEVGLVDLGGDWRLGELVLEGSCIIIFPSGDLNFNPSHDSFLVCLLKLFYRWIANLL